MTCSPFSTCPSPLVSRKTIQPVCQVPVAPPVLHVGLVEVEFEEEQTVTVCPCFTATLRANCMSPRRPLISFEMRFEVVTYLNVGVPIATRMPKTSMTMITSVSVKPAIRPCRGDVFMGGILRE